MRQKWKKNEEKIDGNEAGKPAPKTTAYFEPMYKPKLLKHTPSLRAIRNYNDLPIENGGGGIDNAAYDSDYHYEDYSFDDQNGKTSPEYDYATMGTLSVRSKGTTSLGSELNASDYNNEMGSNVKLVTTKVGLSFQSWFPHISTALCTLCIALNIGNMYRLPQVTIVRGGLPFLVVYIVLTVVFGLPLLFLELGIGKMAQDGFIKCWRAVPFFRGVGYVKLLAGFLLSIYYPLYIGLSLFYVLWLMKGPIPFSECASKVRITVDGYSADSKNGQECLRQTFLKSPLEDPFYFGIYAALLLFIWIVITVLSIRRTRSYIRSLSILFVPTVACYIALTTKTILLENEVATLYKMSEEADWSTLSSAEVWYYATVQVFFSTSIGFGSFITNAGIIFNKVNPLWTALTYITFNLIFGTGSVIMSQILVGNVKNVTNEGDVAEIQLFALIYDFGRSSSNEHIRYWLMATFGLFFFSGLISMATLPYTLLKTICSHNSNKITWCQWSIGLSTTGFVIGCFLLLRKDFDLIHLLDHYIVGNLILISVIIEVLALTACYGTSRITSDFEFMIGRILSKIWLVLWWIIPLLLTGIFAWGLATLPLEGIYKTDPVWLYGTGWAVVLMAFIFIFSIGGYISSKQDGYTATDKFKASLEPSNSWGPSDPMQRHNWIQWNSKTQNGEKDFTLKRRGTKEYTKTIKKNAKKAALSELSGSSLPGEYHKNDTNHNRTNDNYTELYYVDRSDSTLRRNQPTLRVTSLIDSMGPPHQTYPLNPLAKQNSSDETTDTKSNGDSYGTFRNKGPYIINGIEVSHICHRRYSEDEVITEL